MLHQSLILFLVFPLLDPACLHPSQHDGLLHGAPVPHAGQQLDKASSERRGEESIEDGVDTGVAVCQHMGTNLKTASSFNQY